MDLITVILVSVGLAMDAFAVSLCIGTNSGDKKRKNALISGITFGLFQAVMPLIGWLIGTLFLHMVKDYDHWIAFSILAYIGIKMIWDGMKKNSCKNSVDISKIPVLIALAVATSMDALVVGLGFSFLEIPIYLAVILIGTITFAFSYYGVILGEKLCCIIGNKANFVGGIILILIGAKVLYEHL